MINAAYQAMRWPPHLDHDGIVGRLVGIREAPAAWHGGHVELSRLFRDVEGMPAGRLAATVVEAMTWTQDHHGYELAAAQLQIVAMNLKNLE